MDRYVWLVMRGDDDRWLRDGDESKAVNQEGATQRAQLGTCVNYLY